MKKLALRIDGLEVESFATAADPARRGTVRGLGDDCTGTEWAVCGTGTPPEFTPAR
jgi:hypothetical protein